MKAKYAYITPNGLTSLQRFVAACAGGIAGVVTIIVATLRALDWECTHMGSGCNDGQGQIVLVELVPAMFIGGALVAWVWTALTAAIPSESVFSSVFVYDGPRPVINFFFAVALVVSFWLAVGYAAFRLLRWD